MQIRQTDELCKAKVGDLIIIKLEKGVDNVCLVTRLSGDKMKVLNSDKQQQWWSRYVNCEIIGYNS